MIVGIGNIDTIDIGKFLSKDTTARAAIANLAAEQAQITSTVSDGNNGSLTAPLTRLQSLKNEYSLPIGWSGVSSDRPEFWLEKILGLLLTALAASLGAPFWFDVLGKLAALRKKTGTGNYGSEVVPP